MSARICIHLHIKLVLRRIQNLSLQKVATFKYWIKEQDVIQVLLDKLLSIFIVFLKVINQLAREVVDMSWS